MQTLIQKFSTVLGFFGLMLLGFQGAAWAANEDTCTAITTPLKQLSPTPLRTTP
jgi:hypothetical protein